VLEAARPASVAGRMTGLGPGWLLPYLVMAVAAAIELTADRLSVGGFVALAPQSRIHI
jgi:hypothetical protein